VVHLLRPDTTAAITCCMVGSGTHCWGSHFILPSPPQLKLKQDAD